MSTRPKRFSECADGTARVTLRVECGPGRRFGSGKARLLELIDECGSMSAAGRAMDMSYRRAWLLVEEMNGLAAGPLVETRAGGARGGGARLTDLGRKILAAYRQLEVETHQSAALRHFTRLLGG